MLEALGSPGERSILSEKRRKGTGDREEPGSFAAGESQEDEGIAEGRQAERESEERPERRGSGSVDESSEAERREEEEENREKGANSEEASKENTTKDKTAPKTPGIYQTFRSKLFILISSNNYKSNEANLRLMAES